MTLKEIFESARFVVNANGEKTDVLLPLESWKELLVAWKRTVELLEDQEDSAILNDWLKKRAAGEVEMMSLEALEQELLADGLLPG